MLPASMSVAESHDIAEELQVSTPHSTLQKPVLSNSISRRNQRRQLAVPLGKGGVPLKEVEAMACLAIVTPVYAVIACACPAHDGCGWLPVD